MMGSRLQDGFALWREEAEAGKPAAANIVPYTALLPLVGLYVASRPAAKLATSYNWRQTVLQNNEAIMGLRYALGNWASDLDDDFEMPIERLPEDVSWQTRRIDESIRDGLPVGHSTLPWNEEFLAKHLGLAIHDDAVRLRPLRLIDQGWVAIRNHYPRTADYIQGYV